MTDFEAEGKRLQREAAAEFKLKAAEPMTGDDGKPAPMYVRLVGAAFIAAVKFARKYADMRADAMHEHVEKALKLDARLTAIEEGKFETLQRQVSRHADHLARLESWKKERS